MSTVHHHSPIRHHHHHAAPSSPTGTEGGVGGVGGGAQSTTTTDLVALYKDACAHCGCRVNSSVTQMLAKAPTKVLDELSLRNNYVGPKGIHAVLFLIDKCQTLQKLDLSGNGLDNGAIEILCTVLIRHLSISHLDLSDNPITHDAGKFIMRLVEQNPRIVSMRVENTDVFPSLVRRITMAASENAGAGAPEMLLTERRAAGADASASDTTTTSATTTYQRPQQQSYSGGSNNGVRGGDEDELTITKGTPVPPPSRGAARVVATGGLGMNTVAGGVASANQSPSRPSTRGAVVVATKPPGSATSQYTSSGVMKPRPPPPAVASALHSRIPPTQQERLLEQYRQKRANYGAIVSGKASMEAGQPNDVKDVVSNTRFQLMSLEAADLRVQRRRLHQESVNAEESERLSLVLAAANASSSPRTARTATDRSARSVSHKGWMGSDQAMAEEEAVFESMIDSAGNGAANVEKDANGRDVVNSKDRNVAPFVIPYTKDEQFKVLFDAGCEAYTHRNLDTAYLRWNEAMTYAAEQKNREWIAIVTSNLQRLSYELLVAEGNGFVEKSRLDEADKRFAFAQEVAKKARNASWEQDMVRARKNVQHAVFTSCHERSTKLLEQVLKYQHQPLLDGEEFLAEGGSNFVQHTESYHNEYQRLLLLKEAIEGWIAALAIARKITGPSSRVLQDVVNSSMLNVTEYLVQHWFANKDVIKVNGDMTVASKMGTCDFTFDEAKVLHDIWVDLINITETLGCKIFDVVSLMYVGHLAIAMNALQQAVSYFENACAIADSTPDKQDGATGAPGTTHRNRPSSSTSTVTAASQQASPNQPSSPVHAKTFTLDDPIVRGFAYSFLAELQWQRASFGAAEKASRKAIRNFETLQKYEVLIAGDVVGEVVSKESFAPPANSSNNTAAESTSKATEADLELLQYQAVGSSTFYKVIPTYAIRHTQYISFRTLVHTLVSTHRYHDALETLELSLLVRHSDSLTRKIIKNFTARPTIDHLVAVAASTGSSMVYYETATRLAFNPATGKYNSEESLYIWVVPPEGEVSFNHIQVTKDFGFPSIEHLIYQARNAMFVDPIAKMYWKKAEEERNNEEGESGGDGYDRPDEPGLQGSNCAVPGLIGGIMDEVPDLVWKAPLQNLYALLIDPVVGFLNAHGGYIDCSLVTIVPTGALWGVPFSALLDAKDDTFFVEKFASQLSFGALFTTFSVLSALQVAERAHRKTVVEYTDDIDEATMNIVLRRYLVPFPSDAVRGKYEALRLRKVIVEKQYEAQRAIEALHRTHGGIASNRYGDDVLSTHNVANPYALHDLDIGGGGYNSQPAGGSSSNRRESSTVSSASRKQMPGDDDYSQVDAEAIAAEENLDESTRVVGVPPSAQPLSAIVRTQEELKYVIPHARFVHLSAPCTAYMAGTGPDSTAGGLCIASQERGGVSILRSSDIANTEIFASVVSLSQLNLNQSALSGTYGAREGSLCLLRAFAAAGCPSVIGTLWCTPDMTPHSILESYYTEYLCHTGGLQPQRPRTAAQHTTEGDVFSPLVTQKGRLVKAHLDKHESSEGISPSRALRPTYPNKAVALALALRKLLRDPDVRFAPRQWAPYFLLGVGDE